MNRYQPIPIIRNRDGKQQYASTKYPQIPNNFSDIYVITSAEDRYDTIAFAYYNDSSLWWVISSANPQYTQGSLYPPEGVQLRIPTNLSPILDAYKALNNIR
jgi:hypothetical protein